MPRAAAEATARHEGYWRAAWRRLRRHRLAMAGLGMIALIVLLALFAPYVSPADPLAIDYAHPAAPPGAPGHLLGTDAVGRDILARLIYGTRISLQVGVVAVGIAASLGTVVGLTAGYYGGVVDNILMRTVDVFLAFPVIVLAIAIIAVLGPSLVNVMIALGLVAWTTYARVVRGQVLVLRELDFVQAARALGTGDVRILLRHILPNVVAPIIVLATVGMAAAIIAEAALSFLGLGVQPPTPSWGTMLNEGRAFLRTAPHISTLPGLAIMLTVLGFNFLGDGLRDALDPRL
ncbi:MAG: ABC transporter permease [Armatimonadota bacterium]|nr:ABC transporter permease [Armatimonadota bacterium]MDR7450647.1 ABC transporter permease [Armatimonadota bacterium]MDR7466220.1 ABC transporter permease [Armatimonadota bacterium]MDR7492941.1 ABC transporter permease [Armatimonadota bacterium]MDR7498302.1 ABC transporter permease [Armatimonadota bacterium]